MRRALGADRRPVFHRGKQVATVERHNDVMLMRVLARFDRLRERQAPRAATRADVHRRLTWTTCVARRGRRARASGGHPRREEQ